MEGVRVPKGPTVKGQDRDEVRGTCHVSLPTTPVQSQEPGTHTGNPICLVPIVPKDSRVTPFSGSLVSVLSCGGFLVTVRVYVRKSLLVPPTPHGVKPESLVEL